MYLRGFLVFTIFFTWSKRNVPCHKGLKGLSFILTENSPTLLWNVILLFQLSLSKTRVLKNTHEQFINITAAEAACLVTKTLSSMQLSDTTHFPPSMFQPTEELSQHVILGIEHSFVYLLFSRKEPQKNCDRTSGKEKGSTNTSPLNTSWVLSLLGVTLILLMSS